MSPHDFLLHLRGRCPALARRLDGVHGLERRGAQLILRVPAGSWAHRELAAREDLLLAEVRRFFGPATALVLALGPTDPEALPLPVVSSKIWNHVAFWARDGHRGLVLAVRKTRYREAWLPRAAEPDTLAAGLAADPEATVLPLEAPPDLPPRESPAAWLLPEILDRLGALARGASSYAHLVTPFPGDDDADRWEARLYGLKEWGTPRTPGPVLQKYTGRLHYVSPDLPPLGHRLAVRLLQAGPSSPHTDPIPEAL